MDMERFYQQVAGFSPNPLQKAVWDAYSGANGHPALLVRAGTGAGKTEAVLFPALADQDEQGRYRRIVMILPSKALIEDMGARVKAIGEKISQTRNLDITVDMGGACRRFSCRQGKTEAVTYHRHLFADDLILTTLDKFLFRLFGYGEVRKSYTFPHRIFGSALGKKPFVIFDEAHEYDTLAFSNFIRLLEALFIKGKDLCVMSATLPPDFVDFLTPVDAMAGPLGAAQADFQRNMDSDIRGFDKQLCLLTPNESMVSAIAEAVRARFDPTQRIIARTEYVSDLVKLHEALQDLSPLIYHGRLTMGQRNQVIGELIKRQKANQGFLVLATAAIEAGCDLDAHAIITELCNPDSLVQLAGRLNRRGRMEDAELVVVGERIKPFVRALSLEEEAAYLRRLQDMGETFDPNGLQACFPPPRGDWMGEVLFDMLWEYVYEGDLTGKPLWDRGILVTRSWEPAVILCTGLNENGIPRNPIQIGVSRLAKDPKKYGEELKKEKVFDYLDMEPDGRWHAVLRRAFFNPGAPEDSRWTIRELGATASCYQTRLVCVIQPDFVDRYFDPVLGYVKLPKLLLKGHTDGFRRFLYLPRVKAKDGGFMGEGKHIKRAASLWYLER